MAGRRRKRRHGRTIRRILAAFLLVPATYLLLALIGSVIPVNTGWREPASGTTVYLASNGIHSDIIMPVAAEGLDWGRVFRDPEFASKKGAARWIAFGSGEARVYLDTPTWWDIKPKTIWSALAGGHRVMHVQYVRDPLFADRQIRLRPEEYRRLWAAVRADLVLGKEGAPERIEHPGYGPDGAFYRAEGKASAVRTCNVVLAGWLRLAGVKTSVWPPFVKGLTWRYRPVRP